MQGHLFGYKDVECYRLGAHYEQLHQHTVNEVYNYERDGFMSQG
ncbi:catalase [Bombiscardovia coagulans]